MRKSLLLTGLTIIIALFLFAMITIATTPAQAKACELCTIAVNSSVKPYIPLQIDHIFSPIDRPTCEPCHEDYLTKLLE